jgi:hypothetical protein
MFLYKHFMLQYVIPTAAYAVMYSEICRVFEIKAKTIQLHLVGYMYTY